MTAETESPKVPLLELSEVTVWRDQTMILDHVSLSIAAGRHTAIIGPNGSGKTSLLKLLIRQFYPSIVDDGSQGIVKILGRSDWEVARLRRQMGIVSQSLDHHFMTGRSGNMTVRQAVASGFTATELAHVGPRMTDKVDAAVAVATEQVGMTALRDRRLVTLSTGERRRVLIARALVHRPPILVLDEPTSGLDLAATHHFLDVIRDIATGGEVTLLLVTHAINEIIPEIGQVVLMDQGRIVFDGQKRQALESRRLSELFRFEVECHEDAAWYSIKPGK